MKGKDKSGKVSPRTNMILLITNIVLCIGAIVLTVLNLQMKEWVFAGGMAFVVVISGLNAYGCWLRKQGKIS